MKDVLITSSVLILVLLALRQVFRKTISRRVQYALWGLVLVRLLVPVSLPAVEHNVLTAAEPVRQAVSQEVEQRTVYVLPTGQVDLPEESQRNPELQPGYAMAVTSTEIMVVNEGGETATLYAGWMTGAELLRCVWLVGIAVTALFFLVTNLRFWRKLCEVRSPYSVEYCRYPVYLVDSGLPSPCLFGLFRPAIYLTPAAVSSPERLRHVIAHESTHARHLDPLWSFLRCVRLAVYWFDPLVWAAAIVSRTDCELACDEGALKQLGDGERISYGQTLLSLIPVKRGPGSPLLTATTMTADKRRLKDRVTRIAENRQTVTAALFLVLALAAVVCAATFTGARETAEPAQALTGEELTYFNDEFFNNSSAQIRNQFLTSLYEKPEDINMYQLFYNGTGLSGAIGTEERQQVVDTFHQGVDPEVDLTKLAAADVDAVLEEYTGLTLADTQALGMGGFSYLAEYDAYYHFHGDTNAPGIISIRAGEREGDTVRLYYDATGSFLTGPEGDFFADGWACVTLQDRGDGAYWFVSHQLCGRPDHLLPEIRALSGEELSYFNEEFFNSDTAGINIHNQFLTSLYDCPEDIDLYELFYCGTGMAVSMTEEEEALVCNDICPTDKLPVSAMNEVLLKNTGLSLDQTRRYGLPNFTYLEQYDAYYHTHGDTNYFAGVVIAAGEREGDTIRLYYSGGLSASGWSCVTLEAQADGSYWFVSNQPAEKPAIATVYPKGDPELVIPLTDLEPYEPQAVTVERHTDDCAVRGGGIRLSNGISLRPYQSTDGKLYAAVIYDEAAGRNGMLTWDVGRFFTFPAGNSVEYGYSTVSIESFSDLFGYSGAVVSYSGKLDEHTGTTFYDYYAFTEDGTPTLLARVHGSAQVLDMDGDGTNELLGEQQLFFQRDGRLYEADLKALLTNTWPEMRYWDYSLIDISSRCLHIFGFMDKPEWGPDGQADFRRDIYFDGESLLVCGMLPETQDHAAEGAVDSGVPERVIAAAKEKAQAAYDATKRGEEGALADQNFDDWRLIGLSAVESADLYFPGVQVEVYSVGYQFHTAEPGAVMLAGGTYLQEDGWVGGFWTNDSPYLVFLVNEDGTRTQLESQIASDVGPGSAFFRADVARTLLKSSVITYSQVPDADLMTLFYMNAWNLLNDLGQQNETLQQETVQRLTDYAQTGEEAAEDFQQAMGDVFFNTRSLTEQGAAVYRRLVAITNQWEVPSRVRTTAEQVVREVYEPDWADPSSRFGSNVRLMGHRVSEIRKAVTYSGEYADQLGSEVVVYRVSYRYMAEDPAAAKAAGLPADRDGWFSPDGNWRYLYFRLNSDGSQTYLYHDFMDDCAPGDEAFTSRMLAHFSLADPALAVDPDSLPLAEEPAVTLTQYSSYQEAYDSIMDRGEQANNMFSVLEELSGNGFTVVSWAYFGTPHGTGAALQVVYEDGTLATLPLPPRSGAIVADPAENLTLSQDSASLTYTAHFDEDLLNSDRTAVIHRAGTYHYTYSTAEKVISLSITDD